MPDTLRESLEAAIATEEQAMDPAPVEENTSVSQESESAVSEPVSEQAPVEEPKQETSDKPSEEPKTQENKPAAESKPARTREHRVDRAPESWKPDARQGWNDLPLGVRQEIHRRETHVNQVMQESSNLRQMVGEVHKAYEPYQERLREMGVTPPQALHHFLEADRVLSTSAPKDRAEAMARMIFDYGVDFNLLDEALESRSRSQKYNPASSGVSEEVNRQLAPVRQFMQQVQAQQRSNVQTQTDSSVGEIEEMSLNPEYPHFEALRHDMADILELAAKRGQGVSLKEAYGKAMLFHPELSGQTPSLGNNLSRNGNSTNGRANVDRAMRAGSSVSSSPSMRGSSQEVDPADLRGLLAQAFNSSGSGRV